MNKLTTILAAAAAISLASCGGKAQWGVDGTLTGLEEGKTVVLEGINQGGWYLVDTIKVGNDGRFSYRHDPQGYPDIYRLRLGNEAVYFPIDSIEKVTVTADATAFSQTARLSGSPQALNLMAVDSLINATVATLGVDATLSDPDLKRRLGEILMADPAGIVTYYIVSKQVGGRPLFNPASALDNRLIGAVANAFTTHRPTDPRTSYLKRLFLSGRRSGGTTIEAQEVGTPEIVLFDQTGTEQSLTSLTSGGKVVIVNFTSYAAQESPAFNVLLADVYNRYHSSGLEIYQVSVDADEYLWREAAKNLPWVTVLSPAHDASALRAYNVTQLPTTFIIDRTGHLVERVDDPSTLQKAVGKYM